jgi:hypothetical protein
MALVSVAQLQAHLRLPIGSGTLTAEADLELKLSAAEATVLQYIERPTDAAWTATMASWGDGGSPEVAPPPAVQAAILLQAAELYGFRGDDLETVPREAPGDLAPTIKALLYRWRDPALA